MFGNGSYRAHYPTTEVTKDSPGLAVDMAELPR